MKNEQTETLVMPDILSESGKKFCPFKITECTNQCGLWITDDGREECAIVKLAKGWCM